jgi:hypothetical protein
MIKKITDLLYDSTVGLLRDYQRKTIELVKISAASFYIEGIRKLRKHTLYLFYGVAALLMLALAVVITPLAFIALGPWSASAKMIALGVYALIYLGVPILYLRDLFSEKRWMEFTRSQKILDDLASSNNHS